MENTDVSLYLCHRSVAVYGHSGLRCGHSHVSFPPGAGRPTGSSTISSKQLTQICASCASLFALRKSALRQQTPCNHKHNVKQTFHPEGRSPPTLLQPLIALTTTFASITPYRSPHSLPLCIHRRAHQLPPLVITVPPRSRLTL